MPRGVYARKSAPGAGVPKKVKPKAKAKPVAAKPKKAAAKPAPPKRSAAVPVAPKPVVQLVTPEFLVVPDFFRNKRVDVDTVGIDELKAYARHIGITQRDVDGLSESRLRQNCKARILEALEE